MTDKSYPQLPKKVWWDIRGILAKKPSTVFDQTNLAVELSVQPTAAKQYLAELKQLGIVDENSKVTDLGSGPIRGISILSGS